MNAAPRPGVALQRATSPLLMLLSGMASLGYQVVWTQQSSLWLGHESPAVLAVLGAFFGGLALGAWLLGGFIERSARPARWYAACEALIGVWSLFLALALAPLNETLLGLIGPEPTPLRQWSVAFLGTLAVLLPATAAMGATLPAMARVVAQLRQQGVHLPGLYAANTLGAAVGVLAAAFWLVPAVGLLWTAGLCAALNLLCATLALTLDGRARPPATASRVGFGRLDLLLAATGLLGIGYEVLVVRVLSQVCENTVYTYAMLLAIYLVGTALGAAAYQRWQLGRQPGGAASASVRDRLIQALVAACGIGTAALALAPSLHAWVRELLGDSRHAALASEASLALFAFLLPTVAMGALFSHLCTEAQASGRTLGRALGVNTLAAAAAPPLFGVLLAPVLGAKVSLLIVMTGYVCLLLPRVRVAPPTVGWVAALLALAAWAPPMAFVDIPPGGRLISQREGALGVVSILEDARGVATLRINNRQQEGSSATVSADARQALLPLLWHPDPQRALFLGLGTGITASVAAQDPALHVTAVELLPEVVEASAHFTAAFGNPPPPLHTVVADARRYVRSTALRYDVVVADNFHPARSGSGALYTVEHFRAVKARLAAGGLFCQWLPLHQLDIGTLQSIVRSFTEVFPGAWAALATNSLDTPVLALVARPDVALFDLAAARRRQGSAPGIWDLAGRGLPDEWAVWGSFVAGPQSLRRFAQDALLNTDDHPVVTYRAPGITYAADSLPRDRLLQMLPLLSLTPAELWQPASGTTEDRARLVAYGAARNQFLAAGRDVQPSADVRRMLAQVGQPLREVLKTSPDFRPAYDPLLRMAVALGRSEPSTARSLLRELTALQPNRSEAAEALESLP